MAHHTATKTEDDTTATLSGAGDVVEDGTEKEGDDAASAWPAAEAIQSTLTSTSKLRALCKRYGIPADAYTPRAMGDTPACAPPGERHHDIVVYADALDAGMRLPLHGFYVKLLRHYGVAPSQLVPNSWRYMAAFVLLCEEAQVKPMVSVFEHFFTLYSHRKSRGWHRFGPSSVPVPESTSETHRQSLFTIGMPMHSKVWKSKFFVLRSSMRWSCPVSWGEPRDAALRKPRLTDEDMAVVGKLLRTSVAMNAPCVPTFLSGRVLPVGGSVSLAREVKREVEANTNDGAKHTRKRKASEPANPLPPYQQGPSTPPGFASGGGERSATRGLLDQVQDTVTEVEGKEKELQAAKEEVAQLKLELVVARDGLQISEKHAEEHRAAKSASEAEVARLKEELQRRDAELQAAKLQSPERYVKVMKKMKHQISSLLMEEPEEPLSTSSKLTGACSSRARKGH